MDCQTSGGKGISCISGKRTIDPIAQFNRRGALLNKCISRDKAVRKTKAEADANNSENPKFKLFGPPPNIMAVDIIKSVVQNLIKFSRPNRR